VRVAHFGDFGQTSLRDEQAEAVGQVDLLFLPVGDGPTIGAEQAAAIVNRLAPKWVVPMHYRTPRIGFLETADAFLEKLPSVDRLSETGFDTDSLAADGGPRGVVPAAP
jgi:L-ascorbate metabolism protein UlaG (beta-lactamase superfamily)